MRSNKWQGSTVLSGLRILAIFVKIVLLLRSIPIFCTRNRKHTPTYVKEGEAVSDEQSVLARRDTRRVLDADEIFLGTARAQNIGKKEKRKVQTTDASVEPLHVQKKT